MTEPRNRCPKCEQKGSDEKNEPDETTERMHSGASITGKIKRGSDTRDQDEIHIKGKGKHASEAVENFERALNQLEELGWAERLREIQPDDDDD